VDAIHVCEKSLSLFGSTCYTGTENDDRFTKTGSGQTMGKALKSFTRMVVFSSQVRVNATSPGGGVIGVLYSGSNSSTPERAGGEPGVLLAATPVVAVVAGLDGWLRLPFAVPHAVQPGIYWLGWLLEKDQGCFVTADEGDCWSENAWPTPSAAWAASGATGAGPGFDVYATVLPPPPV
jgi:hypothetical protein